MAPTMNCLGCTKKECRTEVVSCGREKGLKDEGLRRYHGPYEQKIVQAAAELVDHGRAGTLSRLEEIAEFASRVGYSDLGIAYCYAMEDDAGKVRNFLKERGFSVTAVSCTVGAYRQSEINETSGIDNVSCNPILQAEQFNRKNVDLVITMGLCLGHDILFSRYLRTDSTNLVVKDRTNGHNPLAAIR